MWAYVRYVWQWLWRLGPVFWHSLMYHRVFPQDSQGVLRDVVAFQVRHWKDFTLGCLLRHRADQYQRRQRARFQRLQKDKNKSALKH